MPAHRRDTARKWHHVNGERHREVARNYARDFRENNPEARLLAQAKNRIKTAPKYQHLEFTIEIDDIFIPEVCPVLGTQFERRTLYAPSLDRIDSSQGYIKDNIQVLSRKANVMKNNASVEELQRFADWVLKTYPR